MCVCVCENERELGGEKVAVGTKCVREGAIGSEQKEAAVCLRAELINAACLCVCAVCVGDDSRVGEISGRIHYQAIGLAKGLGGGCPQVETH